MRLRPFGLLLAVVVASSACSTDVPVAPVSPSLSHRLNDVETTGLAGASLDDAAFGAQSGDTADSTYTVTIDPLAENELHFGKHTLRIPARAICDQSGSYGSGTWDDGCRIEREAVTITAVVRSTSRGVPRIDFSPELRFSPKQVVELTMRVPGLTPALSIGTILYCASPSTDVCIDESATDPELQTYANYADSSLFRRIKHFSGYFVQE